VGEDGLGLTSATHDRLTGIYDDGTGTVVRFDSARVQDDLYLDLSTADGRQLVHIATTGDAYEFSYLGGKLTMRTTKEYVAQAKAQAQVAPDGVSTEGFIFDGDTNALDELMQLPEVSKLPYLSRALGARGFTGNTFPASLALHKVARQSADGLGIQLPKLEPLASTNGYCEAYPNGGDGCYGMCGPGCSCWSWVCGDCCYHWGCAVHDSWCREGKWYWCYDITAVVAIFGC
jgi:hypothetical protein